MRIWNRILLAVLIVALLGTMMPVAAATVSPNSGQWKVYWRFVSPKPPPDGGNDLMPSRVVTPLGQCQTRSWKSVTPSLVWLLAYWLFGVAF